MAEATSAYASAISAGGFLNAAYGPAGMASEIVGRLNAEIGSILSLPEVKKRMEDIAVETASSSPAELAAMTRADADKWGRIIKQLGLAPQ